MLRGEVEQGYITQAEADAANNEPLPTWPPPAETRPSNFLVAEVQDRLLNDPRLGQHAEGAPRQGAQGRAAGVHHVRSGGCSRSPTTPPRNAKPASPSGPDWVSSLVAIESRHRRGEGDGRRARLRSTSQYNIATHPPGRQPGSTWKVITLAAALANGYSPNDIVDGTSAVLGAASIPGTRRALNSTSPAAAALDLWAATSGSVNCAFVRLSTSVGHDKVIAMAHDMGITKDNLLDILNLTLGTREAEHRSRWRR